MKKEDESLDLVVEEVTADNPTDVEKVTRISLCDMLLKRGLAFRLHTRKRCSITWSNKPS